LIHAVEVALESVNVSGPEAAELGQPAIHLLKWFRSQPVKTALCIDRRLHEPRIPQNPQVLGDGRLRHVKLALDFSHGVLGRG
jgi:hypothetical protein